MGDLDTNLLCAYGPKCFIAIKFKFKSRLFQLLHIRRTKIQEIETVLGLFAHIVWP